MYKIETDKMSKVQVIRFLADYMQDKPKLINTLSRLVAIRITSGKGEDHCRRDRGTEQYCIVMMNIRIK
eukprot:6186692-Heterocapsa_arctica.AAC.1